MGIVPLILNFSPGMGPMRVAKGYVYNSYSLNEGGKAKI
jgi:hypothetical protein